MREFLRAYDPNDPSTMNPQPENCTGFCMFIYNNKQDMFSFLMGAMLVWIILNVITGAFMSSVPELAKRLANWQNMASQTPAIGGAGETIESVSSGAELVEEDAGGFTMKERTGVYSGGSIWGLGIGPTNDGDKPARPGAAIAAVERFSRMGQYTYRYDEFGNKVETSKQIVLSPWDRKNSQKANEEQMRRRQEAAATALNKYLEDKGVTVEKTDEYRKKMYQAALKEVQSRNLASNQAKGDVELENKIGEIYKEMEAARRPPPKK
jgi:hypothetical protein